MPENNPEPKPSASKSTVLIGILALFVALTAFLMLRNATLTKQNREFSADKARLEQFIKELEQKTETIEKEKAELIQRVDTVARENKSLKAELDQAKSSLSSVAEEKTYLEDILIHKTKELEKIKVNLGSITMEPQESKPSEDKPASEENPKSPRQEGRVLAVNEEHGFVVVDLGKSDGVGPNTLFSLNKNGELIGTLKVLEIRDIMTACTIKDLNPGRKIEINDLVLTRK